MNAGMGDTWLEVTEDLSEQLVTSRVDGDDSPTVSEDSSLSSMSLQGSNR